MLTTCPRCGTRSPATSDSCRDCGHDLYRVAYPTIASGALRSTVPNRVPVRLLVTAALLLAGAGASTGLLLAGGEEKQEPISKNRPPASAVPREPTPSAPPSSPEPSRTKAPPKPAPVTTQPTNTPSASPSPTRGHRPPFAGIPEAQRAFEFADQVTREWTGQGPGQGPGRGYGRWNSDDYE